MSRSRDHPPDHRQLLEILLAEQRDVGPDRQQQLGDDRRDAVEMARAAPRLPSARDTPATLTVVAKPVGIDVARPPAATAGRSPPPRASRASASSLPRIAVEVLAGAELRRIDEDRRRDPVGPPLALRRPAPCARRGARPWSAPARALPPRRSCASASANSSLLRTICTADCASDNLRDGAALATRAGGKIKP